MPRYPRTLLLGCMLAACETGPHVYFGTAPNDAGARDARTSDAQNVRDAGGQQNDDEDGPPCRSPADCAAFPETPFCHPARGVCSECLQDTDCDSEQCDTDGECSGEH